MTKRVLLAGVLGAVAMFIWASVAHMVLPLGTVGVQEIPNEQPVLAAMSSTMATTPGLYMFPGMGLGPNASMQERNAAMPKYEEKLASSPSGLLIYHPAGSKGMTGTRLLTEFLTELAESLIVVFLLAQTNLTSFGSRLGFVTLAGLLAAIATNIPYWNWYGFPSNYTASYMFTLVAGYFFVGIVAALVMKTSAAQAAAARAH